jgi:hypothetical protein
MKTAVEFYREKNIELLEELRLGLITHLHWYQKQAIIFEQAKEMEKEQIIEAHFNGCETGEMFNNENRAFITDSKQYYNKTFKQQEQ